MTDDLRDFWRFLSFAWIAAVFQDGKMAEQGMRVIEHRRYYQPDRIGYIADEDMDYLRRRVGFGQMVSKSFDWYVKVYYWPSMRFRIIDGRMEPA